MLPVTGKAIADRYKKLFPGYHEKLPIEAVEPQVQGAPIRIILGNNGEAGFDVMMMPTPIPPDMLTFAYAMNSHWPEARAELQRCRSHVAVIALQRQDGKRQSHPQCNLPDADFRLPLQLCCRRSACFVRVATR